MDPQTLLDKLYNRPKHPIISPSHSPIHKSSSQMSIASSESSLPLESPSGKDKSRICKRDHWMKDEDANECCYCKIKFSMIHRKQYK